MRPDRQEHFAEPPDVNPIDHSKILGFSQKSGLFVRAEGFLDLLGAMEDSLASHPHGSRAQVGAIRTSAKTQAPMTAIT
jgi:hypothetical protein